MKILKNPKCLTPLTMGGQRASHVWSIEVETDECKFTILESDKNSETLRSCVR